MAALYGIVAGAHGLTMVFGGGLKNLSSMITKGDLDTFLTQPKNIILSTVSSHSLASGWGDFITCFILTGASGYLSGLGVINLIFLLVCGSTIFLSMGIIFNSLAFFLGHIEGLARQLFEYLLSFSVYPQVIFTGFIKIILFTVLPAGFIGYVPVTLFKEFSWLNAGVLLGAVITYLSLAVFIFGRGLKHYTSGNQFTTR